MKEVLTQKENIPFTQVANAVLEDKVISWKAKGIFAYLYSRPQDWDFSGERIVLNARDGRDSTYAGLKELEEAGYLKRARQSDGRVEYEISWRRPVPENPEKPLPENPYLGKSHFGKSRRVSNKDCITNKEEERNKDIASTDAVRPDSFFNASKRGERKDDAVAMELAAFVLLCRGSQYRHIRLIGEHADEKKPSFSTRGQWREFGRRNMRSARRLSPYTDRQIEAAFNRMMKDQNHIDSGRGFKWTMETLEKYLDES